MNNRFRRLVLTTAAILTLTAGADAPNIIFILADDLGYGDLGCYGQTIIQTPAIDKLAEDGMRFTHAYAGSTVCAPSRSALMTGQHTGHTRVRGNDRVPLEPEDVTVAEVLKAAGYRTGLVGKWGLGEPDTSGIPNRQGFDYFYGYLNQKHAHNFYPEYLWRNETMIELEGNEEELPGVAKNGQTYSPELFTEEALAFIERNQNTPFFLYLAHTLPHANNERGSAKGDGMEIPDYGMYANEDWPNPQKGHAAMITYLDTAVGQVLATLDALNLADNTLVIFTSDNGPHREGGADPDFFDSNGELQGIKRSLYHGGIRVPMIARWPGVIEAGSACAVPVAFWDFLPTAAEITGREAPANIDGASWLGLLKGEEPSSVFGDRVLYWEFHEGGFKQALRKGNYKLVRQRLRREPELFRIDRDPAEANNIAREHPDLVEELSTLFTTERTYSEHWPGE